MISTGSLKGKISLILIVIFAAGLIAIAGAEEFEKAEVEPAVYSDPIGHHDASNCAASLGWTCDDDDFVQSLTVMLYADGPAGSGTLLGSTAANQFSGIGVGQRCGGNRFHGFSFLTPASLIDGSTHSIFAYAINIGPGNDVLLSGSPKKITCTVPVCGNGVREGTERCDSNALPCKRSITGNTTLVNSTPVYRLWNDAIGDHFYTTSSSEKTAFLSNGYIDEGILSYIYPTQAANTSPVYRFYSASATDHFYTLDQNAEFLAGYTSEGILGYLYPVPTGSAVAVYRLYNSINQDHFYTTDLSEAIASHSGGWADEGILGYISPNPGTATVTQLGLGSRACRADCSGYGDCV